MSVERLWLIRTAENVLAGPVPRERVLEWIEGGRLGAQDEVCAGGSFWFYLSEAAEVKSQLGLDAPILDSSAAYVQDEITQTQTVTDSGRDEDGYPEMDMPAEDSGTLPRRARSRVVPVGRPVPVPVPRAIESTSVWKGIAWALAVIMAVLLVGVFRALQR